MITADFKNIYATARETSSSIRKEIKSVISEVLDYANDAIEDGDEEMLNRNFDDAIKHYSTVPTIVGVIPADPNSIDEQRKQDLIDTAMGQIAEAQLEKKRLEEAQAQQASSLGNN